MKVDPNKTYSLSEIVSLKLFPGCKSFSAAKTIIMRDMMSKNVLRSRALGTGNATRIYIDGADIIKFLKTY